MGELKTIDGYLSRKCQQIEPKALVYKQALDNGESWTLEIEGRETIGLGDNFGAAKQAVHAWIRANQESE